MFSTREVQRNSWCDKATRLVADFIAGILKSALFQFRSRKKGTSLSPEPGIWVTSRVSRVVEKLAKNTWGALHSAGD
jgi:hypothetical protein